MRPFLKRVGGKTKLLAELKARMPLKYGRYYEPFVGGGALFFDLTPKDAVINDASVELMDTYRTVQNAVDELMDALAVHQKRNIHESYYYEVRDQWNAGRWEHDIVGRAAAFIYFNKTGFNGLWRVNKKGEFNVPRGDYDAPKILDVEALRAANKALQPKFTRVLDGNDYVFTAKHADKGDFVYMDPPYDPVSKTSNFTAYTKNTFGEKQQEALAQFAEELMQRGVYVMLSNNDTPFIRDLYKNFCIDTVQCGRSINSKGDKRGKVDEVIITSYPVSN